MTKVWKQLKIAFPTGDILTMRKQFVDDLVFILEVLAMQYHEVLVEVKGDDVDLTFVRKYSGGKRRLKTVAGRISDRAGLATAVVTAMQEIAENGRRTGEVNQ